MVLQNQISANNNFDNLFAMIRPHASWQFAFHLFRFEEPQEKQKRQEWQKGQKAFFCLLPFLPDADFCFLSRKINLRRVAPRGRRY
jgi:hypothetical protein